MNDEKEIKIDVADEFILGILKANELTEKLAKLEEENTKLKDTLKSRNEYIDELEDRGSYVNYCNLLARYNRLQEMYNELMGKNLKLQKIIDVISH